MGHQFCDQSRAAVAAALCHPASMTTLRSSGVLTLVATALLLVGCSGPAAESGIPTILHNDSAPQSEIFPADQIPALFEPQDDEDHLPAAFSENGPVPVTEDSIRLLADYDGVRYFVGLSTKPEDVCLMVYRPDGLWGTYCSGSLPFEIGMGDTVRAQLIIPGGAPLMGADESPPSAEWHLATENLIIEK